MAGRAITLKEEGNRHFQRGDYTGAEGLYSEAIIADSKNAALYTNRALVRLKLEMWDSVVNDCKACLDLAPDNMKAHYYLSQAELSLKDYEAALAHGKRAQELCIQTEDKSITNITNHILACKKARWEDKEKRRVREGGQLETEVVALMERERDEALNAAESDADRHELAEEWARKLQQLRDTFERSRSASEKKRRVPEWAVDDITFGIMVDPVITKTGKSYERAAILEHLRRQCTDPLTREPLTTADLRPNRGLKMACEEFLDENGWAVDW
ncbi:U-box domain-containing protein [Niveomyces insectorum RCEF 264]|uniref:U-box domain-containing protein n=1 Tax=Niveomyces insectorum RCEF 264 TaxID=1081102 RepID=A0A167YX31_9HYPO|nr:U-box domain-containing protein [Niveomyces insectorum RCEF 264]